MCMFISENEILIFKSPAFQVERNGALVWQIDLHAFVYHLQKSQRSSWRISLVKSLSQQFSALQLSNEEEDRMVNKLRVFVTRVGEPNRNITFTIHFDSTETGENDESETSLQDLHFTSKTAHDGQVRHRKVLHNLPPHAQLSGSAIVPYHVYTKPQGKVSAFIQFIPRDLPYVRTSKLLTTKKTKFFFFGKTEAFPSLVTLMTRLKLPM